MNKRLAQSNLALLVARVVSALFVSVSASAGAGALRDVDYNFNAKKLMTVTTPYELLTTFVDYSYLLVRENAPDLSILKIAGHDDGWCVGDAHPQNFGALIQEDGQSEFAVNDMDDAGPCPVILDLLRLAVGGQLFEPSVDAVRLWQEYQNGLAGHASGAPAAIISLMDKSTKRGAGLDAAAVSGTRLQRGKDTVELSAAERADVELNLREVGVVLDAVNRQKVGGGSGGLLRYEALVQALDGTLVHLELKEQTNPGVSPMASDQIPATDIRIKTTLKYEQGSSASHYYTVVKIGGRDFLRRPRFAGNVAVNLSQFSPAERRDILNYEAGQLGLLHARSVHSLPSYHLDLKAISGKDWSKEVAKFVQHFQDKFKNLPM